ncbi:MAG: crossover junction endodeoxyribonuclease RuvC [Bacteroidota bacterium]
MGIDPGTQITGYGLIACKGKKIRMLACGEIRLGKGKTPHPERLKTIFQRVKGLIQEYKPDEMALEAPFYGKNVQSMLKLGRAQGVAMAAGLMADLPIYEYAPRKVKVAVTGQGAASKEQVKAMLEKLLQVELNFPDYDATDGLAVAVCHFFQGNLPQGGSGPKDWAAFLKENPDRKLR